MAEVIPEKLPRNASKGEERVFSILKKLPDDYIVYYEPLISQRRPDFIVIGPDFGVLVIEVKGWRIGEILSANDAVVTIDDDIPRNEDHPLAQARQYMWDLARECKVKPIFKQLIHHEGDFKGKFIFPFGHMVVLSNIKKDQLINNPSGDFSTVFRDENTITRNRLLELEEESPEEIKKELIKHFNPFFSFPDLTENQIEIIRGIIHPEIIIKKARPKPKLSNLDSEAENLKIATLDIRQQRSAINIGGGHHIIYGVAGSGKTIILQAKAKLLAQKNPDFNILVLCYNVMLGEVFKQEFKEFPGITAMHFDAWSSKKNNVKRYFNLPVETDEELGERLFEVLKSKQGDYQKYDAILIDEAQDFPEIWFKCVLLALKDPEDGDLFIVLDENQSIRKKRGFSWKNVGINVLGRGGSIHIKFGLDKNYRNTRQILELASFFAVSNHKLSHTFQVSPACALREGLPPLVIRCMDHKDEGNIVVKKVQELMSPTKIYDSLPYGLRGDEIGILYPRSTDADKVIIREIRDSINAFAEEKCIWLNEDSSSRKKVREAGVKIQTVNSAKGLQYRVVILIFADTLPMNKFNPEMVEQDKKLMYVALTRAEDFLIMTYSKDTEFIELARQSKTARFMKSKTTN